MPRKLGNPERQRWLTKIKQEELVKMKDGILLLGTSLVCAAGAWLFWRTTGQWGFLILATISYCALMIDNVRLRKRIKELMKPN